MSGIFSSFILVLAWNYLGCHGSCDLYSSDDVIVLTTWSGTLWSPGYPEGQTYPDHQNCTWNVKVSAGSRVKVKVEAFYLEEGFFLDKLPDGGPGKQCWDRVTIIDSDGETLFSNCGTLNSQEIMTSSGRDVTIHFVSDNSTSARGFKISYVGVCGGVIPRDGLLESPNYPGLPPPGVTCTWNVPTSTQALTQLSLTRTDHVTQSPHIPACGNSPLKIISEDFDGQSDELCEDLPTLTYVGTVDLIYDSSLAELWTGRIQLDVTDDQSCDNLCGQASSCRPERDGLRLVPHCVCLAGYQGVTCEQRIDSCRDGNCRHENCVLDIETQTAGRWCVSPDVFSISQAMTDLLSSNLDPDEKRKQILHITYRLALVTSSFFSSGAGKHSPFPGDLLTSADVIVNLSKASDIQIQIDKKDAKLLAEDFSTAVDNIFDPGLAETWTEIPGILVEERVRSVVSSVQTLVTNVVTSLAFNPEVDSSQGHTNDVFSGSDPKPMLNISKRNLDLLVNRLRHETDSPHDVFYFSAGSSSLSLPVYEMDGASSNREGEPVNVYLARFQSIASLLAGTTNPKWPKNGTINSDVISAEVLSKAVDVTHLRNAVTLTFKLKHTTLDGSLELSCVFMNMTSPSLGTNWASDGCQLVHQNKTHVVCKCFHLTNFAVLVDVHKAQESIVSFHDTILSCLSYIGGVLSIASCVTAVCVFQYFRLSSDRVRIHQQLAASIVIVQVLYFCVANASRKYHTPHTACCILAVLMHYALTAMFSWMLIEGIHLYVVLVRVFRHGSHIKTYTCLGWGLPLIVVAISVAIFRSEYGAGGLCWLNMQPLLICFVPTIGLVLMINTFVLITVIRVMVKSNLATSKIATSDRNIIKAGLKATVVLLPLLGLTWLLGFLAVRPDQSEAAAYIFTYLFTVTNSGQGVFFLVMHCLLNIDVHQAYERRFNKARRMSREGTTSSRIRKFSENDFSSGSKSDGTTTSRSTSPDLTISLPRLSILGQHQVHNTDQQLILGQRQVHNTDQQPILGLEVPRALGHVIHPAWKNFTSARSPAPDFPQHLVMSQESAADDTYLSGYLAHVTPGIRDDVTSDLISSRSQRNSVRFVDDGDLGRSSLAT